MFSLFIDTHGEVITVALVNEDEQIVKSKESIESHSVILLPLIDELFKEKNIDFDSINEIIVVNGPGSFTGLRIGLTEAKIMGYTLNIPVKAISSLTAYLVSFKTDKDKACIIKDNKGYYISVFDKDNRVLLSERYLLNSDSTVENYEVINNYLDIKNIYEYARTIEPVFIHNLKANYVKKIEAEK